MNYCPECGAELEVGTAFCGSWGARIGEFGAAGGTSGIRIGMPKGATTSDIDRKVKREEEKIEAEYSGIRYHNREKQGISKLKTIGG